MRRQLYGACLVAWCSGLHDVASAPAALMPVRAAVVRSQGTMFLDFTIWRELNAGWMQFGDVPVEINYSTLAGYGWGPADIAATGADVLILSASGYLHYTDAEIDAVVSYVRAGHGLIVSYDDFGFDSSRKLFDLAPLVGLTSATFLGGSTWRNGFTFDLLVPDHPLFVRVPNPYATGTPYLKTPMSGGWRVGTGTVLARANPRYQQWWAEGIIVANDAGAYRGVYFPHYIEDRAGGSNEQDMQVFYNALLWTAFVPEPGSLVLLLVGCAAMPRRPARRSRCA